MMSDQGQDLPLSVSHDQPYAQYQLLQAYLEWTGEDAHRVLCLRAIADRLLPGLVDDFYSDLQHHYVVTSIFNRDSKQFGGLKPALKKWLRELFCGNYDAAYVDKRCQVGKQHAEAGLPSIHIHAAISCLRQGLMLGLQENWPGEIAELSDCVQSLNRLLDLDLAMILYAYQAEIIDQLQRTASTAKLGDVDSPF